MEREARDGLRARQRRRKMTDVVSPTTAVCGDSFDLDRGVATLNHAEGYVSSPCEPRVPRKRCWFVCLPPPSGKVLQ